VRLRQPKTIKHIDSPPGYPRGLFSLVNGPLSNIASFTDTRTLSTDVAALAMHGHKKVMQAAHLHDWSALGNLHLPKEEMSYA
jgi:hypothetical protein